MTSKLSVISPCALGLAGEGTSASTNEGADTGAKLGAGFDTEVGAGTGTAVAASFEKLVRVKSHNPNSLILIFHFGTADGLMGSMFLEINDAANSAGFSFDAIFFTSSEPGGFCNDGTWYTRLSPFEDWLHTRFRKTATS